MRALTVSIVIAIIAALGAVPSRAGLDLQCLQTKTLRVVYYDPAHAYIIPHLARCFENSYGYFERSLGYVPGEEVTILLQDFDDYGYAGTSTIPNNYITLGIEPFEYVYETCPTNERFNWVMSHELFHVVASEKTSHIDRVFRSLFRGKVLADSENPESMIYSYLCSPRRFAPRWYHEGIACFMETWLAGGIGRSLGGYDEMAFRAMVRDRKYFYDIVGLESEGTTSDFQIGQNSYLYGTRFMSYLAAQQGPERVMAWVNRTDSSDAYYASQFHRVFGVSLEDMWERWIEFEHEWQARNLETVAQYPLTHARVVGTRGLGSVSRGFVDPKTGRLLVAVNYPGAFAHVASVDLTTGEMESLHEVKTPALYYVCSLAFDPNQRRLFYTTNNGKHWRDLNAIDLETRKSTRLISDCRIGDLAYSAADSALWGVQHHNGFSTLVRIASPYNAWKCILPVMDLTYGRDVFDLDVAPDGKHLTASILEINGDVKLVEFDTVDLLKGGGSYRTLYEFDRTAPANFVYAKDGKYLYGTSYQTGVSNVFKWDFERAAMDCVTNTDVGFFRPIPMGDSLVVFAYAGDGFHPAVIADTTLTDVNAIQYLGNEVVTRYPELREWKLPSPRDVNLDSLTTYRGVYHNVRSITAASIYPVAEYYKAYTTIGVRWNFMDPLGVHGGDVVAGVSPDAPDKEMWHAKMVFRHFPWTLKAAYNRSDFYDFFGPTKVSRKGHGVVLERSDFIIADRPRYLEYTVNAAWYGGLERLPYNQNVLATFNEYGAATASLDYKRVQRTIGAVDDEKGVLWSLGVEGNLVNRDFYGRGTAQVDVGALTPIDHSSVWLRAAGGYSRGNRDDSFASFYFGGFGNNYVDHQEVKRYRNFERFPGAEIDAISGTNFARAMVEWTLPPVRFRRAGVPKFYCTYARPALFTIGLVTNMDDSAFRREAINWGGQIDFRLVIFSALESTLSIGAAAAKEEGREVESEFMISLKIM